jgi:2,3-bisphosphoglycerate-independent phosphoglycerate mutase
MTTPTVLLILDGVGLNPNPKGNAVAAANKPNFDKLWSTCAKTTLITYGERVGLPEGQMGNSEVGHQNIGAGRVVEQWLLRITRALKKGFLSESPVYKKFAESTKNAKALHLLGLYSDGGVHSLDEHAKLLIEKVSDSFKGNIYIHLITDGRDTSPFRAGDQLPELVEFIKKFPRVKIATISGRYFTMDRDNRWERVEKSYQAIVNAKGEQAPDVVKYIQQSYEKKITDEFIEPAVVNSAPIAKDDGIIFWNFREDRMREIVRAICIKDFNGFARGEPPIGEGHALGFTDYDHTFHLPALFEPIDIKLHLGEALAKEGIKQLRVAETEKYAHVTFFFNGGYESPYPGEDRTMVPSPKEVKTYDLKPEMSARGVTEAATSALQSGKYGFIVVNLANGDMVGHTGNIPAATKAIEVVDECLGEFIKSVTSVNGTLIVLADHGNSDQMINYETGLPHTAHTLHPVPFIVYGKNAPRKLSDGGALCDVAPTVLEIMGVKKPAEMTGNSLVAL